MKELNEAIEICYKKDMELLKKAHHLDKIKLTVAFTRKYPNHSILGY